MAHAPEKFLETCLLDAFLTKKFPHWIKKCHIFANFLHFWPCHFFSNLFRGRLLMWHEKLVVICLNANFLNFHLTKSNFWLGAIYSTKGHLNYLFRIEEVHFCFPSKPYYMFFLWVSEAKTQIPNLSNLDTFPKLLSKNS